MLTRADDVLGRESLKQRLMWVMTTEDAEQQLSVRRKQQLIYLEKAVQPLTDLLNCLKAQATKSPAF